MSRLHRPESLIRRKDGDFMDERGHWWFAFDCPSESRAAERHNHDYRVRDDGAEARCSCPYADWDKRACTLVLCAPDIARAERERERASWPEAYAPDVTGEDVALAARLGSRLADDEPPPADPGSAALDAAQADLDLEYDDWGEAVELSPEHPGGFWTATAYGPMHVSGDPHMSDETLGALREMAELAVRQHLDPAPNDLDSALALAGGWWAVSRAPGDWPVILTCNNCGATRGWRTEAEATRFIREDGACRCDGDAGPTPPAQGAARRPMADLLADLGMA